jgi:dolichol-phosphate mannosyltransferase
MILVVLPAYNEEEVITPLIGQIRAVARKRFIEPVKVIVVDDGSADETAARVRALEDENTLLVQHPQNRGLGEAIKTGLLRALDLATDDDIIVTMDADNTHTPGLLPRMINTLEGGNEVVIASRYQPGARVVGLSPWREFLSTGMRWLFQILLPIRGVRDYSCGYRAYRASILRRAFSLWGEAFISQSGFSCMVDILLKLNRLGAVMTEVPLVLHYENKRGKSKMNVSKTIRETLRLAWQEKIQRVRGDVR